jgi:hypothetical protein
MVAAAKGKAAAGQAANGAAAKGGAAPWEQHSRVQQS